jgi:ubiquinone/menaquinone biosynthesis C-methylase UbiE
MLKSTIRVVSKKRLNFVLGADGRSVKFKPWLGDSLAFLYDLIMEKSIFPSKFAADMTKHCDTLRQELNSVHGKRVLELATGSGSAVSFLPNDNAYVGTDISPGLLRRAVKRFRSAGFENARFYVSRSEILPFEDESFDLCLCILSLNFFADQAKALKEAHRILVPGSIFICAVPVPERNRLQNTIRGRLYSERELTRLVQGNGFCFESIPCDNGALLYFRGVKE